MTSQYIIDLADQLRTRLSQEIPFGLDHHECPPNVAIMRNEHKAEELGVIEAIALSVNKWAFIAEQHEQGRWDFTEGAQGSCGLCLKFFHSGDMCDGCPIFLETGGRLCRKFVPYNKYHRVPDNEVRNRQTYALAIKQHLEDMLHRHLDKEIQDRYWRLKRDI